MRTTIKTQNMQEGFDTYDKIGHLITEALVNASSISFLPLPNVKVTDIAKLLSSGKSVSCNLATRIAWLEELSVVSECTGEQYCLVGPDRLRYDPIARPAIINKLIQKHRVDLDWQEDGTCWVGVSESDSLLCSCSTEGHNGCFATTVLTVILEAQS